jgi:hypothetical protein
VAKKKSASRKPTRAKKASPKSRRIKKPGLDTRPLQEHIKKRIKELEGARPTAAAAPTEGAGSVERLKLALETLEAICFPSMTIPI